MPLNFINMLSLFCKVVVGVRLLCKRKGPGATVVPEDATHRPLTGNRFALRQKQWVTIEGPGVSRVRACTLGCKHSTTPRSVFGFAC